MMLPCRHAQLGSIEALVSLPGNNSSDAVRGGAAICALGTPILAMMPKPDTDAAACMQICTSWAA